jgi:hypothetical protein
MLNILDTLEKEIDTNIYPLEMELESLKTHFDVLGWLMINMLKAKVHEHCFSKMKFISPAY